MSENEHSRRLFIRVVGASVIGGACGLPHLGCKEGDGEPRAAGSLSDASDAGILEVAEGIFRPTAVGATVHWVPSGTVESQILAGTSVKNLEIVKSVTSGNPVEVKLEAFSGVDQFFWQCRHRRESNDKWIDSPTRSCRTQRRAGETFRVALFADSHYYSALRRPKGLQNIKDCVNAVQEEDPDFGVFIGDEVGLVVAYLQERPGIAEGELLVQKHWREWRQFINPLLAKMPTFFILGNHEAEAGYYQKVIGHGNAPLQTWATNARKRYYLNPLPTTYDEGGEDQDSKSGVVAGDSAETGHGGGSPLQNYYAWTWGDGLFVVLDVHRYTNFGKSTPSRPEDWTLGFAQRRWFEQVLIKSTARWKFVIAHHLVGGSVWDSSGIDRHPEYAYGRGGAKYARIGEQSKITDAMRKFGAQFFVYGHDHIFAHQEAEGLHFICCGRPTMVPKTWVTTPGFIESYGRYQDRNPHAFIMDVGYTRLTVSPNEVAFEYIKTGVDPRSAENTEAKVGDVVHRIVIS